jgi:hypothetical protein
LHYSFFDDRIRNIIDRKLDGPAYFDGFVPFHERSWVFPARAKKFRDLSDVEKPAPAVFGLDIPLDLTSYHCATPLAFYSSRRSLFMVFDCSCLRINKKQNPYAKNEATAE